MVNFINKALFRPHGFWDAWAIWNLRAKFIIRFQGDLFSCFENMRNYMDWSHIDYPLLLPLTVARFWTYVGGEFTLIPIFVAFTFTFTAIIICYSGLYIIRGPACAILGTLVLMGTEFMNYGIWQYADVPLASFLLLSLVIINIIIYYDLFSFPQLLILNGIILGLGAWTKNEGMAVIIVFLFSILLLFFIKKEFKSAAGSFFFIFCGMVPVLVIIFYFKWNFAPSNDLFNFDRINAIFDYLSTFSRYTMIAKSFPQFFIKIMNLTPIIVIYIFIFSLIINFVVRKKRLTGFLMLAFILFGSCYFYKYFFPFGLLFLICLKMLPVEDRIQKNIHFSLCYVFFILIIYFFVYVLTPNDLSWHIRNSMDRLIIHIVPLSGIYYFSISRDCCFFCF